MVSRGLKTQKMGEAQEKKRQVLDLEQFYVNGTLENMDKIVETRKNKLVDQLIEYKNKCKTTKYTKDGEPYEVVDVKSMIISSYFFKSLNPLANIEPEYTAEQLGIVYQLYMYLIEQVNIEIGDFSPNLTHFAKFAGITLSTLKSYRKSNDLGLRTVTEKIFDMCFDGSMTMAQEGKMKEKSTIFRAKSELDVVEKANPNINVNVDTTLDLKDIQSRLSQYDDFNSKLNEMEGEIIYGE